MILTLVARADLHGHDHAECGQWTKMGNTTHFQTLQYYKMLYMVHDTISSFS